jgi:hypothetical protein
MAVLTQRRQSRKEVLYPCTGCWSTGVLELWKFILHSHNPPPLVSTWERGNKKVRCIITPWAGMTRSRVRHVRSGAVNGYEVFLELVTENFKTRSNQLSATSHHPAPPLCRISAALQPATGNGQPEHQPAPHLTNPRRTEEGQLIDSAGGLRRTCEALLRSWIVSRSRQKIKPHVTKSQSFSRQMPGTASPHAGHRPSFIRFRATWNPTRSIKGVLHAWQKVFSPSSPGMLPVYTYCSPVS